ncbi:hypothetical protein BDM02DRAFT_3267102 [Thelephora ganbajun]|uniref:Uncharacterized protein n=1 Tax=Thelephora ganbajun TaxID=370292 RepID=A0ACB6ZQQ5_THEGA|nr:hypothetical protein BDM02DRAFT_3267102 [Thelephora ganbajun]
MYEDVCLQCGKPLTDGYISPIFFLHSDLLLPPPPPDRRAYCSYDCESLDATSPSISTASSVFPSPHLGFTMSPTPDRDIPALLPIALGGSGGPLQNYSRYRSINNHPAAFPRHSALSPWSPGQYTEDENDHPDHTVFYDPNEKHHPSSGLNYARRPSSTNWHSTIPRPRLVRASDSGASSPVRSSVGAPQSAPSLALPPTPPSSGADDELSDGVNDRESTIRVNTSSLTRKNISPFTKTSASKKRNRASLPAYFSLLALTSSSPGKQSSQRIPSTAGGVNTSRNISRSSPYMKTAPSTSAITPTTVHANQSDSSSPAFEQASLRGRAERGRSRHQGPDSSTSPGARNDSRNRSLSRLCTVASPSRSSATAVVSVSPCPPTSRRRYRGRRIGSHEKVSDWVSTSIDPESRLRSRSRRYSNESDESEDPNWRLRGTAAYNRGIDGERRGRRRANELGAAPADANGPGFGSGRSGLKDRERRGVVVQNLVH